jgi:hypothetical protein
VHGWTEKYSTEEISGLPGERCIVELPVHSQNLEDYAATITRFYRAYPSDRQVPVFKLIEGLSDAKKL